MKTRGLLLMEIDEFMMKIDQNTLFDLILAANYLNMKGRLDLRCQTVADMIKGKTPEKMLGPHCWRAY